MPALTLLLRIEKRLRRIWRQIDRDRFVGVSAEIAFYELMALIPYLAFLVAIVGLMPSHGILDKGLDYLGAIAPGRAVSLLESWLASIRASHNLSFLSLGAIVTLWVGSAGIGAFIDAFSVIFRGRENLSLLRSWILRFFFAGVGAVGVVGVLFTLVVSPAIVAWIARIAGFETIWTWTWAMIRTPLILVSSTLGVAVFYRFLSRVPRSVAWHLPGAIIATILLGLCSWLFSLYVAMVADFDATYGSLGGIILLMFWFQALNLSILVGASWNAQKLFEEEPQRFRSRKEDRPVAASAEEQSEEIGGQGAR
jgi:membrane protein